MMDEIDLQLCLGIDSISPTSDTPRSNLQRGKRYSRSFDLSNRDTEPGLLPPLWAPPKRPKLDASGITGGRSPEIRDRKENYERGYLRLPPRKRVRTSLSFSAVQRKTNLGTAGSDPEERPPGQTFMDFAGEDKVADTDVDMDAGAEGRPQNIDEPRPHPPPLHHFLLPPVPPPVSFEPPASLPSLPCGSSFTHDDSVPQTDPFEIFEDPGPESSMFMEIDLPCFVDPSWYITPDDNKENTNEDVQQHDSQVTEYRSEQDYHLTYAELGLHEPILALENPHHRHATTLAEVTIASEGAGIEEHQHPLPSPTTLSATEVSLRALPSQTAATDGSLNPASNLRSVPRRILRLT